MKAPAVVKALDVEEQVALGLAPGGIGLVVHQLGFSMWETLSIGALSNGLVRRLTDGMLAASVSAAW